jgi:hypothetical protein
MGGRGGSVLYLSPYKARLVVAKIFHRRGIRSAVQVGQQYVRHVRRLRASLRMRMSSIMRRRTGETFLFGFERLMTLLRLRYEADCLNSQHTKQRNGAPSACSPAGPQRSHPYRASGFVHWPMATMPRRSVTPRS